MHKQTKGSTEMPNPINVLAIVQGGRLEFEAVIFAASFRAANPNFEGRLIFAEPQPGPLWRSNPKIRHDEVIDLLEDFDAEIIPFESRYFGEKYPYGNKIEALKVLPEGENFIFFDTDTLHTGPLSDVPFDFDKPSASMRREGTWPKLELYGPNYAQTWKSLYDKFGLDFESSLDLSQPDEYWQRFLYFNAGFFYYKCPKIFGEMFTKFAVETRDNPPDELVCQELNPWLDQVVLPLVIHALGGGRDALPAGYLDGETTCHYRLLQLLYARESDRVVEILETVTAPNKIKKVIKNYDPIKRMIYQSRGHKARAMFDRDNLPKREQKMRNMLKKSNLWLR
ncbi:hypothetical protein RB2150_04878 [Rhodobacterales bacterium HTCC2150]|nr:hypothetical protein RB2150_04878 [Rhodobacterales bacterium HTCC2150] [Rhodobacteraceae bacterium HTCC2150]